MYKLFFIGIMFVLGLYFISKSTDIETFANNDENYTISEKCPDVLIQKGSALFLYNSKRANVPGVNPIKFENLEEYVEFTEWQRSQGILCPILFLQHAYNAQGEPVYKARPSPTNLQGGLPDHIITSANLMPSPKMVPIKGILADDVNIHENQKGPFAIGEQGLNGVATGDLANESVYNTTGTYIGFDAHNQIMSCDTPIDKMFNQTKGVSPNPMDDNWGGVEYTENLVKSGYYKDNEVSKVPAITFGEN